MGFSLFKKRRKDTLKPFKPVDFGNGHSVECIKLVDTGSQLIVELVVVEPNPNLAQLYYTQLISYACSLHSFGGVQYSVTLRGVRLIFQDAEMAREVKAFWAERLHNN